MLGTVQHTSWNPPDCVEQSVHTVTRALEPGPGCAPTDFGFVPDSRVFSAEVAGEIENVPAHLLSIDDADEPEPPIMDADA